MSNETLIVDLPLKDRLVDVEYIKLAFRWENIIFIALSVVVIITSKFTYVAPLVWARKSGELGAQTASIDIDHELTRRDNKAVAVSFAAYMVSVSFVLAAVINNRNDDPVLAVMDAFTFVVIGMLLLLLSQVVNDKLILTRMLNARGLMLGNVATAAVEGGGYIAAGLLISGSVSGSRDNLGLDLLSCLLFFTLGQVLFVAQAWFFIKTAGYDVQKEVHSGNVAAGLSFGLSLATFGLLISNPISKSDSLLALAIWGTLGILLVFLIRVFIDKFVLFGRPLKLEVSEDRNWGAAAIEGLATGGAVICINIFLPEPLECLY